VTGDPGAAVAVLALPVALLVTPLAYARGTALRRSNYRGRSVSLVGGVVALVLAACAGGALGVPSLRAVGGATAVAVLAAGTVGLFDDLFGTPAAKGLAGHARALLRGRVTTGAVKAFVVGLGALGAALVLDGATPRALLDTVLVAGWANLVNLFDLRPGRALKVVLIVTLPLLFARSVALVAGWLAGTVAGLLPYDLRERTMLGDTGANALGAAVGVLLAALARDVVVAAAVAVLVVALTVASERVSFTKVIEGVGPLRRLDALGRRA
jgi:UDP-N-acetylmuramyl pentapeptide phosphotransferase/UDP-N-acetylglucosamine-1-phosphate transferase